MREFANVIAAFQPPPSCKILDFKLESSERAHTERPPHFAVGELSLCDAVRVMLAKSNIPKMYYEGPIDPTLFWPDETGSDDSPWKCFVELNIWAFDMVSLSGQWFFKGVPEDPF